MKRMKRAISAIIIVLVLSAFASPMALASVTIEPLHSGVNRATRVRPIDHRRVTADLYIERLDGSSLYDVHRANMGQIAHTRWLNSVGMVIIRHNGWVG